MINSTCAICGGDRGDARGDIDDVCPHPGGERPDYPVLPGMLGSFDWLREATAKGRAYMQGELDLGTQDMPLFDTKPD